MGQTPQCQSLPSNRWFHLPSKSRCLSQIGVLFVLSLKERSLKRSIFFSYFIPDIHLVWIKKWIKSNKNKNKNWTHFQGKPPLSYILLSISHCVLHTHLYTQSMLSLGPPSKTNLIFSYLVSRGHCGLGEMGSSLTAFTKSIASQLVQFSRSVVSDSLRLHESQHARPPCPSQHQSLFQWVNSLHQVAKVLEFQL